MMRCHQLLKSIGMRPALEVCVLSTTVPTIILLNGASSAGKTSLCKQLQIVLDEPYMHLQEDAFVFNTYHERWIQPGPGERIFAMTMLAYYRSIRACVSAGHNLLVDTGFYSADLVHQCVRELHDLPIWLVGVHCSLAELERREQARGDRQAGIAREQFYTIHTHVAYDIEVDTSDASFEVCADYIKTVATSAAHPTAMQRLYAQFAAISQ
jgi:chloramphenicol 3-O phosphotransferase